MLSPIHEMAGYIIILSNVDTWVLMAPSIREIGEMFLYIKDIAELIV